MDTAPLIFTGEQREKKNVHIGKIILKISLLLCVTVLVGRGVVGFMHDFEFATELSVGEPGDSREFPIGGFKPTETLCNKDESKTMFDIYTELQESGDWGKDTKARFVDLKFGAAHLYLTVDFSGAENIGALIVRAKNDGVKKLKIFTGRHGGVCNMFLGDGQPGPKIFVADHDAETAIETAVFKKVEASLGNAIEVEIVDCLPHKGDIQAYLATETKATLAAGTSVIYSWCYSVTTFETCTEADQEQKIKENQAAPIKELVAKQLKAALGAFT